MVCGMMMVWMGIPEDARWGDPRIRQGIERWVLCHASDTRSYPLVYAPTSDSVPGHPEPLKENTPKSGSNSHFPILPSPGNARKTLRLGSRGKYH